MKAYEIYSLQDDRYIGKVEAWSIADAERRASAIYNMGSDELYALSEQ